MRVQRLGQAAMDSLLHVACLSARNPARSIGLNVIFALICSLGFLRIKIVSKGDQLWVDQNSIPAKDYKWMIQQYGAEPRYNQLIIVAHKDAPSRNLITKAALMEVQRVYDVIKALRVDHNGRLYSFSDICLRDFVGRLVSREQCITSMGACSSTCSACVMQMCERRLMHQNTRRRLCSIPISRTHSPRARARTLSDLLTLRPPPPVP